MSGFQWSILTVEVTIGELKKKQKEPPTKGAAGGADVAKAKAKATKRARSPAGVTGPPPFGGDGRRRKKKPRKQSRHMQWRAGQSYKLIREGTPITEDQIDTLTDNEELAEDMFFIFKHRDEYMDRNETTPQYEAVFLCAPTGTEDPVKAWNRDKVALSDGQLPENYRYTRTQKRHLDKAYTKSERKDRSRMWEILGDGTPYWVDRYVHRVKNERAVKQRHEEKKRRQRQAQRRATRVK